MLPAFKQYLITLKLSVISRKLYMADIARFLAWVGHDATLDRLKDQRTYLAYLEYLRSSAISASMLSRTLASLRQFGSFIHRTYNLPNPSESLGLTGTNTASGTDEAKNKYIKYFTNYLNTNQLSSLTIKSYKSDVSRYMEWMDSTVSSNNIQIVLSDKNIEKYLNYLADSQSTKASTIERKAKSLARFRSWYESSYPRTQVTDNRSIAQKAALTSASAANQSHQPSLSHTPSPTKTPNPGILAKFVKKINSRIRVPYTWSLSSALSLGVLLLFIATLGFFAYRQLSSERVTLTQAFPNTPVTPNRQLSFQGRLENASGTPITSATNFVFKLWDNSSGGTQLYTTGTCSITPDTDGVFNTQIGNTCGSAIASSVFTENADVWLEVTVASETLTPRQQIATVAFALNAETVQGFPISATVSAVRNTVVPMNQWGEILVGEQSPRMRGVSGTFQISAPALSITTNTGTNGNISIAPDGTGQVNVQGNTTSTNFFNVSNAQLTTGSLITGTAANNNSGFKLLDLLSGSSPTSKFSVDASGNTSIAGSTITLSALNCTSNTNGGALTTNGSGVLQCSDDDGGGSTLWTDGGTYIYPTNAETLGDSTSGGSNKITGIYLGDNNPIVLGSDNDNTLQFNGTLTTVSGATQFLSNLTLGDASTDTIDFKGRVLQDSDLVPITTTGINELGSSTLPWDYLYIDATYYSAGGAIIVNDNTANSFRILQGAQSYFDLTTTNGSEVVTLQLPVGGTGNLFTNNLDQTTNIGTGTGINTINIGTGATGVDDINIGGHSTSHTDFTGIINLAGGTTYYIDASGNARFNDIIAADTANPGLTVGNGSIGFMQIGGTTVSDNNGNLGLELITPRNLLTVGDYNAGTNSNFKQALLSTDNTLLAQLEGGSYFGNTGLTENHLNTENHGNTWSARDSSRNWQYVAVSSSGKYQTAIAYTDQIYTSEDYGATWTARDSNRNWQGIVMSSDGKFQTATVWSSGQIYTSEDYGATWTARDSNRNWRQVAMSSDGKMQTALAEGDQIYTSYDYGVTWTARDSSRQWFSIAMSSDGKVQTAGVYTSTGQLYTSYDYGVTWTAQDSNRSWRQIAMSSDGKRQTAINNAGQIYTSGDYGDNWTARDSNRDWTGLAVSSDAKVQMATVFGGQIYVSTNYGVTWTAKDSTRNWTDVSISSDGRIAAATVFGGQIYVSFADSYLTGSNLVLNDGQLQLGNLASAPTAVGAGAMYFNTTTSTHQCYNGTNWYNCGGTLYSNTNASVADGSYITVAHNLASNDLLSSAWINSQGVWKSLDASYRPAIAWEGKDTTKGIYHNAVNSYTPVGNETGAPTSTLHEGMIFDTFEDTTKTDSANTTASYNTQIGDDGSSNYVTLDQRVQGGRVGLMGGQTLSTSETDNDGQTYLGSNTVNDMYYYDRSKDSTPEVLVELGIDPNWYNGVTLSVATTSANYSPNGTLADKNPNLTPTYNGSLIKVTGTDSTPRTIFITIKSPTTFDWTNYQGDSATGVTITPGTAQTLGATGVSATFSATNYNVGDVFKIASWFIEAEGTNRGAKQPFPERSIITADNTSGVSVIDMDTQKLWIRFSGSTGIMTSNTATSVSLNNGSLFMGTLVAGMRKVNFATDEIGRYTTTGYGTWGAGVSKRNDSDIGFTTTNSTLTTVAAQVNDLATAVIPNQPTQEVTVSGWGYVLVSSGTANSAADRVNFPYKFNETPVLSINMTGRVVSTTVPTSQESCSEGSALRDVVANIVTQYDFVSRGQRTDGVNETTSYYYCFGWTATGVVSPKQLVAIATGATSSDGGTTIINETDGTKADIDIGSQIGNNYRSTKVALTNQGNLYHAVDNSSAPRTTLDVYYGAHNVRSESTIALYRSGYYATGEQLGWSTTGPVILGAVASNEIKSLEVSPLSSTNNALSNTIYVGTTLGVTKLDEFQGFTPYGKGSVESFGSVKYYTKDYISEEMIGDIRGMWPLNNSNSSSDFEDVSIKANNLTGTNITASGDSVSGVRGTATDFDGSTEFLSLADDPDLDFSTTFSTSVWIKTTDSDGTIFRKWQNAVEDKILRISNNKVSFYLYNVFGGSLLTSNQSINDGNWHFITATYDGTTAKVYIDGQLDNAKSASGDVADGTGVLYIAANNAGIADYAGTIDELTITATAITANQVKNMYQTGYRALQSHGTNLSAGSADGNQALAGASNIIGVVAPDYNNQYMYVGSNHTTDGALTKIQLNSDTAIKNWDTGDNDPDGGAQIVDDDITSLAVGETLYAVGSAASGVKSMGLDDNATATSGNFVSKTYTLPKNIGSAVLWVSPITDSSDGSNTITVQASNDGGSSYATCTLVGTNNNYAVPEREYACTFSTADNDLKVRFQFARGSTKTNTYVVQYGISWLGETGFRVEQADANNTRLYNFSGETQNLKLNITGASTASLASPWTDAGSYLYPTGYESLRLYDGAGTNYLGLRHDGTNAVLTYNGTDFINLTSTGDLLPETNDTQALGSDSLRWEDIFIGPSTIHIGTSSTDEGLISYDTTNNIFNFGTDSTTNGDIAFFGDDLYLDKSTGKVNIGSTTNLAAQLGIVNQDTGGHAIRIFDGTASNLNFRIYDGGYTRFDPTGFGSVQSCVGASCTSADSGTFTNNTTEANTTSGTAFSAIGTGTTATFYVGLDHRFNILLAHTATAAVGNTMVKEYWNGSAWAALPGATDNTNNLTLGSTLTWTTPSDWATRTVNGVSDLYWVRLRSSTNVTTAPTLYFVSPTLGVNFQVLAQKGDTYATFGVNSFGTTEFYSGNMHAGRLMSAYVTSDSSASNEYFAVMYSATATDIEFLFRTDGTAQADGSFTGGGADVAEYYYIEGQANEGDLVAIPSQNSHPAGKAVIKSRGTQYDNQVIGIVSTNPGLVAGGGDASEDSDRSNQKPIALAGRVPVKVSLENGIIRKGDHLTSSSTPGVAMKATQAGPVIGQALEDYDGSQQLSDGTVIVESERLALSPENLPLPLPNTGVGKIMAFVKTTWHDPGISFTEAGELVYNNTLVNPYQVVAGGQVVTTNGNFAKTITGALQAGIATISNLISPTIQTATISPLSPGESIEITAPVVISPTQTSDTPALIVEGEIEATTVSARLAQLESIQAETITARDIVADTITANTIVGLDAKIATLSAGLSDQEFETITDRIKDRLASLTGNTPNAGDIPIPEETNPDIYNLTSNISIASSSATLASADIDFATINNYLAVIGQATITTLDITNGLYTDTLASKNNLLAIQPLGGTINLANNTLIVDSTGQVVINGDLTVSGKILADSASFNTLELGTPSSATPSSQLGQLLSIYNEQGEAVATIDASGSANLASLTTNMITIASPAHATESSLATLLGTAQSNATAGESILVAPGTELVIESPYVTPNSLVYLTPTGNTDNKVLFVKAKNTCPPLESNILNLGSACVASFTVGIDSPTSADISFNWWIIELAK